MNRNIRTLDDVLRLLDSLFVPEADRWTVGGASWWDGFYADRSCCFHHLPPHRRLSYLAFLDRALAPGGHFALTCFAAGAMGSELPDADFYRQSRLHGGLAYTPESLRWIFSDLTEVEVRRMRDEPPESPCFGEPFLWSALFRRDGQP
jgi:hypothetical protein